jgi:hypothetical protein
MLSSENNHTIKCLGSFFLFSFVCSFILLAHARTFEKDVSPSHAGNFSLTQIRGIIADAMTASRVAQDNFLDCIGGGRSISSCAKEWNLNPAHYNNYIAITNTYASITIDDDGSIVLTFNKNSSGVDGTLKLTPSILIDGKSIGLKEGVSKGIFLNPTFFVCTSATHMYASAHNYPFSPGATMLPLYAPPLCR